MKKIFYFVTTLLVSLLWLQEVTAQRIPFQGRLFEDGQPITGTVNLVFSIDGTEWEETHNNVSVSDGLYSVELGSTSPVLSTLFFGVESRLLTVTVNGVALEPITIYPSLTTNNFVLEIDEAPDGKDAVSYTITGVGTAGKIYRPFVGTSSVSNGLNGGVTGIGISPVGNANNTYGIFGRATGEGSGQNRGVYGEAISHSTSSAAQYGIVGRSYGEGTGAHYGIFAEVNSPAASAASQYGASFLAQGNGTGTHFGLFATSTGAHDNFGALTTATGNGKNNIGIRGLASGTGNGETGYGVGSYNTGVQGFARSNSWGNTGVWGYVYNDPTLGGLGVDNIGVIGRSEVSNENPGLSNIGLKGDAWGTGINRGVFGTAQNGVENWAGWFEGDVKITGNLELSGVQNYVYDIDEAPDGKVANSVTLTGVGTASKFYSTIVGTSSVQNGFNQGVTGIGDAPAGNTNTTYGVIGRAIGEGSGIKMGVYGNGTSSAGSTNNVYGLYGLAQGGGTGIHYGLFATSSGNHDNFGALTSATGDGKNNVGIRGLASGTGNGETGYGVGSYNTGVQGFARSNSWGNTGVWGYVYNDPTLGGVGVDNIGVVGRSEVSNENPELTNIGIKGDAWGSGINKGVVGTAQNGVENWAGWFEGDVKIAGNLMVDGEASGFFKLPENVNIYRAEYDDNGTPAFGGEINLSRTTGTGIRLENSDSTGGHIALDGTNGNYIYLWGNSSVDVGGKISLNKTEGSGEFGGELTIWGQESPNFILQGQGWNDMDMANMSLFGNQSNGEGWYHDHISLSVGKDGDQQWGNISIKGSNGNENIVMGGKSWEGTTGANRPFLRMRGQDTNQDLVWLDVRDDGDGGEMAGMDFRSTSGSTTLIDSRGVNVSINNNNKVLINTDSNDDGQIHVNSQSGTALRMYSDFDNDNTSHIALDGTGGNYIYLWGQGNINATGTVSANVLVSTDGTVQTSDLRLKTNILDIENALDNTMQLRGVSYNWSDPKKSQSRQIGLIAQEVEQVYPELVQTLNDGTKAVNYTQLVAVLVESIKELNKKIESLEDQNKKLEANLRSQDELMKEMELLRALVLEVMSKETEDVKKLVENTHKN